MERALYAEFRGRTETNHDSLRAKLSLHKFYDGTIFYGTYEKIMSYPECKIEDISEPQFFLCS